MNKKISLVALFGLLFLFGCGTQTTPSDTTTAIETPELARQTYQSKTDGYSLKIPADRTFQEKVFGADVMFFSPLVGKDTIKENLGIVKTPLTKSYTLAEYSEMAKSELAKRISGFVEVSDETITLGDITLQKLVYKGTSMETSLEWKQFIFIQDNAVYTLSYTATEASFDDYAQIVDDIVATLQFSK